MEKRYSYMNQGSIRFPRPNKRNEEFREEDVWNVMMNEHKEVGLKMDEPNAQTSSPVSISRRVPSAVRMIPGTGKKKHQSHDSNAKLLSQHSAPVNIPDWHKIYGTSHGHSSASPLEDSDDDEDEDELHSHEWLAKKFERNRVSSFSVCEGVGRTLKGRDLCRVRDAVLSKTGFI